MCSFALCPSFFFPFLLPYSLPLLQVPELFRVHVTHKKLFRRHALKTFGHTVLPVELNVMPPSPSHNLYPPEGEKSILTERGYQEGSLTISPENCLSSPLSPFPFFSYGKRGAPLGRVGKPLSPNCFHSSSFSFTCPGQLVSSVLHAVGGPPSAAAEEEE